MIVTPADLCFLEGHGGHIELVRPEPEDYPLRADRLICSRCDAECTNPAAIRQWRGLVAGRHIDTEIPRFLMEAV